MGLAPLGEPEYLDRLRPLVKRKGLGFALDLAYFVHHSEGVNMTWEAGSPTLGPVFSAELETLLGPRREQRRATRRAASQYRCIAADAARGSRSRFAARSCREKRR